jgi:hypothetical protein
MPKTPTTVVAERKLSSERTFGLPSEAAILHCSFSVPVPNRTNPSHSASDILGIASCVRAKKIRMMNETVDQHGSIARLAMLG